MHRKFRAQHHGRVLLNAKGGEHFRAFSAGSHPAGEVHPLALELIRRNRMSVDGLRSKNWDEFSQLSTRISLLINLPYTSLDQLALTKKLDEIGKIGTETPQE